MGLTRAECLCFARAFVCLLTCKNDTLDLCSSWILFHSCGEFLSPFTLAQQTRLYLIPWSGAVGVLEMLCLDIAQHSTFPPFLLSFISLYEVPSAEEKQHYTQGEVRPQVR